MSLPLRRWGTSWRAQNSYIRRLPSTHSFAFNVPVG